MSSGKVFLGFLVKVQIPSQSKLVASFLKQLKDPASQSEQIHLFYLRALSLLWDHFGIGLVLGKKCTTISGLVPCKEHYYLHTVSKCFCFDFLCRL